MDRLLDLEGRQERLKAALDASPPERPDIHPNIAALYARKVERLVEALNRAEDRDEASDALRRLIERVTLTPGKRRGEMEVTLRGEFGAILEWLAARETADRKNDKTPGAVASGLSVTMVAGTGFEPVTFRL